MPRAALVRRYRPRGLTSPIALKAMGLLIRCKDASRLISQMQDRRLTPGKRWLVRLHLLFCDACSHFQRQLAILREAMVRYRE